MIALVAAAGAVLAFLAWRWSRALAEVSSELEAPGAGINARPVLTAAGTRRELVKSFNAAAAEAQARTARLDQDRQQLLVVLEAMAEAVVAVDLGRRLLFANARLTGSLVSMHRRLAGWFRIDSQPPGPGRGRSHSAPGGFGCLRGRGHDPRP